MGPRIPRILRALATSATLVGCAGSASEPTGQPALQMGGQTGGEAGIACTSTVNVAPLALATPSPLGFSGQDVIAALSFEDRAVLSLADLTSPALRVAVAATGSAGYAPSCASNEVDITLGLTSSDGAFAERLPAKLFAHSPDQAHASVSVPLLALTGNFATSHPELAAHVTHLEFDVDFSGGAVSGSISTLSGEQAIPVRIATF
jgi:hypothetical protein